MPAGLFRVIWLTEIALLLAAVAGLAVRELRIRKTGKAAMHCVHALGLGCLCTGCGGASCSLAVLTHCACPPCLLLCAGPHGSVHGGPVARGGSGSTNTVHFTGGGGGIVSGSSGAGGGAGGSYTYSSGGGSYSPGGPLPRRMRRSSRAGIEGFDERGAADFGLAPGRVLGLRQWSVTPPDLSDNPLGTSWAPEYMTGATGKQWTNRVFEAECTYNKDHRPPVDVDEDGVECGCGIWGYWSPDGMNDWSKQGALPVAGIIEGTGRTLIGDLGFRCQRARIVALSLPFLIRPAVQGPAEQVTDAELAAAWDTANAWMAVIQDRIGLLFPDARMFATVKGMLAAFPPGERMQ